MLGNFFYGRCSLHVAFWKYSVLGLFVSGGLCRLLMTLLKQKVNYNPNFLQVAINSLSFIQQNTAALAYVAFYIASFIALVVYAVICILGMWNTYKEYDKSKLLALICVFIVAGLAGFAIKYALY